MTLQELQDLLQFDINDQANFGRFKEAILALKAELNGSLTLTDVALANGLVSDLAIKLGVDENNGFYGISDAQLGVAIEGVLVAFFDTLGLKIGNIGEQVTGAGVTIAKTLYTNKTASAINATATATPAEIMGGLITSTSAAGTSITLPTGTNLGTAIGAVKGTSFDLTIDNTAGASKVTLVPSVNGIASVWTNIDDTLLNPLEVAAAADGVGIFRFTFVSATAFVFSRIG